MNPILVVEVPLDGLADACLECLGWLPAKLTVDLGGIDRIAAIMTGSIGDVGDLLKIALSIGAG